MARVIRIARESPDPVLVGAAVEVLRRGGVLAFPTETFYGLGADGLSASAVKRVFAAKRRPVNKPLLVLIAETAHLDRVASRPPELAYTLARKFWPGPLTLVLNGAEGLPGELTGFTGKIGVRVEGHPVAAALVRGLKGPLTATSANLTGHTPALTAEEALSQLGDSVDLILDAGECTGGAGSTVLDLTSESPLVLREGRVPSKVLASFWEAT